MTDEFIQQLLAQFPTLGVLIFLVWQQWTLVKHVVEECLEDKDDEDP